jgi:hypothetical protein
MRGTRRRGRRAVLAVVVVVVAPTDALVQEVDKGIPHSSEDLPPVRPPTVGPPLVAVDEKVERDRAAPAPEKSPKDNKNEMSANYLTKRA